MSVVHQDSGLDPGVLRAQRAENVLVGDVVVRHKLASRAIHWSVALTFFLCLFTGLPIWMPAFKWMASFFGGLSVCRVLHPYFGFAFFVAVAVMFFDWLSEMHLTKEERSWIGPRLMTKVEEHREETGKYNAGQKLYFFSVGLGALGVLLTGLVMFLPESFPLVVREIAVLLHDFTFIVFAISVVFHVYLSTAAEPGTFQSMTKGTVTRRWARFHHPRWLRDLTGRY